MKLNKVGKKISFIFIMLVISLTLFLINKNINVKAEEVETKVEYIFDYTGGEQTFIVPTTGKYKIELWGAQGYSSESKGAYTYGEIKLNKNDKFYIYVGQGNYSSKNSTSFNGGTGTSNGYSGGGATDIRLQTGDTWKTFESLKSRIMVAAGSGSGSGNSTVNLGYGGILAGSDGNGSKGGTQTSAGKGSYLTAGFGYSNGGCSGGNGYYAGGGASCSSGAGGGSSYISGYEGCDSISESSTENNIVHTGQSIHYSKLFFSNSKIIAGNEEMPTHDGTSTMIGNAGNGYAKITLISVSNDNKLNTLISNYGNLSPAFDSTIEEYTLTLDKYTSLFTLSGELSDENAEVIGLGKYKIDAGETKKINIVVTAVSGDIKTYTINVTRESLNPGEHTSKLSKLDVVGYEDKINPEFHPLTNEYNVEIMPNEIDLNIKTETFDSETEVTIIGNKYMTENSGVITITVTEPHSEDTIYTINYTKVDVESKYDFEYTGDTQEFVAPVTGIYKIESWGAQGGYSIANGSIGAQGGLGGYSSGQINLNKKDKLYIYM